MSSIKPLPITAALVFALHTSTRSSVQDSTTDQYIAFDATGEQFQFTEKSFTAIASRTIIKDAVGTVGPVSTVNNNSNTTITLNIVAGMLV